MSLLPYILDELLLPTQATIQPTIYWLSGSECPRAKDPSCCLRSAQKKLTEFEKQAHIGKDGFQVCLDVRQFQPNEVSVKTVDNSVVVEANHEERQDSHGYIARRFTRRYELPQGYKAEDVVSTISSDGILQVKCPKPQAITEGNVRHVQIQQTGPARLNVANKDEKAAEVKAKE